MAVFRVVNKARVSFKMTDRVPCVAVFTSYKYGLTVCTSASLHVYMDTPKKGLGSRYRGEKKHANTWSSERKESQVVSLIIGGYHNPSVVIGCRLMSHT